MFKRIILPNLPNTLAWLLAWIAIAAALLMVAGAISGARAETFKLKAGNLLVDVDTGPAGRKLERGAEVVVKFRIRTTASELDAEIKLDHGDLRLADVTGKDTDSYRNDRKEIIEVNGLQRDEIRIVIVEFKMGAGRSSLANRAMTANLGITIVDTDSDDKDTAKVHWPLEVKPADQPVSVKARWKCAGNYSKALKLIGQGDGRAMTKARSVLRQTDKTFPGFWYFATDSANRERRRERLDSAQQTKRYCLRFAINNGKQRCLKWTTARFAGVTPSPATKSERKVYKFLTEFMERRGYAPEFGDNGRYRWLIPRLSMDLNRYVAQPPHIALCTGVPEYLRFHKRNYSPFVRRAKRVAKTLVTSNELARVRVSQAIDVASLEARDHAATVERLRMQRQAQNKALRQGVIKLAGNKSVSLPGKPVPLSSLLPPAPSYPPTVTLTTGSIVLAGKLTPGAGRANAKLNSVPATYLGMINALAPLVLPADRQPVLKAEKTAFSALKIMSTELAMRPIRNKPNDRKVASKQPSAVADKRAVAGKKTLRAVLAALRTIEAGVYAQMLSRRYVNVNGAITGTLTGIASAHKKHCGCAK